MAKQTGLHQIRGKVGEHSYYRQSGVSSGLIRGINPGMSQRVKTAPEYANTRLNNKEFKTASRMAASMIEGIQPRWRPMFNTFKNAKLSSSLLEVIKSHAGVWGKRSVGIMDRPAACVAVNKIAKNNWRSNLLLSFRSFNVENKTQEVTISALNSYRDYLESIGATGVKLEMRHVQIYEGAPTDDESARAENIVVSGPPTEVEFQTSDMPTGLDDEIDRLDTDLTILNGHIYLSFYVVVAQPYRTVGNTDHILQEACTFQYFADPEQEG